MPGASADEEQLGSQQVAGIECVGRRITITTSVATTGHAAPVKIIDERWESPDLKLLIYSTSSDPRTGIIEYRLTNLRRADPAADLFTIPEDYTIASTGDNGGLAWYTRSVTVRRRNGGD